MNKKSFYELLLSLLGGCLYHQALPDELGSILIGSGVEKRVFTLLAARLTYLAHKGILATDMKEFEPITDGIYSMHLTGSGFNIRILYGFFGDERPVLLLAFHKKAGKSVTDYSKQLPVALARLASVRKEYHDV